MAYREEFREVPFWRGHDSTKTTSDMLQQVCVYCDRYQNLSVDKKKWAEEVYSGQAYAEFLFQVNHIEGEGFDTLATTQDAIAGGALQWLPSLEDDVDDRVKHVSNLYAALCHWFAASAGEEQFDTRRLMESHRLLLSSVRPQIAGRLRNPGEIVYVSGPRGKHYFVNPEKVGAALARLMLGAKKQLARTLAVTNQASRVEKLFRFAGGFFFEYESIHPFVDGNGRTGRIIVAHILRSVCPFPNVLFVDGKPGCGDPPFVDRQDYLDCFSIAQGCVDSVPRDLTALLVEGVYVGWKRFFAALDSSFQALSRMPTTGDAGKALKRKRSRGAGHDVEVPSKQGDGDGDVADNRARFRRRQTSSQQGWHMSCVSTSN